MFGHNQRPGVGALFRRCFLGRRGQVCATTNDWVGFPQVYAEAFRDCEQIASQQAVRLKAADSRVNPLWRCESRSHVLQVCGSLPDWSRCQGEADLFSARPGKCSGQKSCNCRLATEWHVDVQDSQGLNVSMEDRVRRKLNAMGFVNLIGKERATDVMFKRSAGWTGSVYPG